MPATNTDWMEVPLEGIALWADPGAPSLLAVPMDNAGWHIARRLPRPPNVCRRDLQPAEPPWPLVREAVATEGYNELGALEPVLAGRCRSLIDHPEVILGRCGFCWAAALNG